MDKIPKPYEFLLIVDADGSYYRVRADELKGTVSSILDRHSGGVNVLRADQRVDFVTFEAIIAQSALSDDQNAWFQPNYNSSFNFTSSMSTRHPLQRVQRPRLQPIVQHTGYRLGTDRRAVTIHCPSRAATREASWQTRAVPQQRHSHWLQPVVATRLKNTGELTLSPA